MVFFRHRHAPTFRRLRWALLMPIVLLLAQQGALVHEYGHRVVASASGSKEAPAAPDRCPVCLAYAHLCGAVAVDAAVVPLLSHLAFHFAPRNVGASIDPRLAEPRNRGPPVA